MSDPNNPTGLANQGPPADWRHGWPRRNHLLHALATGRADLAELIIKAGVDPNEPDALGETALHDAVRLGDAALRAVEILLPYITRREHLNEKGATAADIATEQGRLELAFMIREEHSGGHWLLQQARVSDQAKHLHFAELENGDAAAWALRCIQQEASWCKVPADCMRLRQANLPFYPGAAMLAIEDTSRQGPREQFALIRPGLEFKPMTWTNEPIYRANENWAIRFDCDTLPAYIHTFFHFVRGQMGRFQIVEQTDDIAWRSEATSEWKDIVRMHLQPPTVVELDADRALYAASVVFKNALFLVNIFVALQRKVFAHDDGDEGMMTIGQCKLLDERVLLEDMPVMTSAITAWG